MTTPEPEPGPHPEPPTTDSGTHWDATAVTEPEETL